VLVQQQSPELLQEALSEESASSESDSWFIFTRHATELDDDVPDSLSFAGEDIVRPLVIIFAH